MRKGRVRITLDLIGEALEFPSHWEIESMDTVIENGRPIVQVVISGSDFPEEPIKDCQVIVHRELSYEVKETA